VTASFAADDSYGSSSAATAVSVGPAHPAPEQPAEVVVPDYSMLLTGIVIAVIIAILIGVVNLVVYLRKRQ
jgi:hypothetical protein